MSIDAGELLEGINDLISGEHSGGQQIIAGLVLLMSMAETEGDSFFFVDEPFAHLPLDRVDDVGKFLRRSGVQFLMTVPTTLDRGQLDFSSRAAEAFFGRDIVEANRDVENRTPQVPKSGFCVPQGSSGVLKVSAEVDSVRRSGLCEYDLRARNGVSGRCGNR
jgi:hypothetical protein